MKTASGSARVSLPLAFLAAALLALPHAAADESANKAWATVPQILGRIVPPVFPKKEFDITAHGAKAGGKDDCSTAFSTAIRQCAEAGGGRVSVPAGKFLTGPIHLRSNVELHLSEGSEILFSDRFEDYLPVVPVRVGGIDILNYSPLIYARDCTNVAITGKGRLNGNAANWWRWKGRETTDHFKMGAAGVPVEKRVFGTPDAAIRPNFVVLLNCRNILLQDFTIGSGPNWTIHPVYSENITIRGVTVETDGPNNDGIDPDSCRDVLVEHCTFSTGDDCLVLKSGYNVDGWRVNRPTENVIMRHCSSRHGHGGLVIGSEMSGGVRNVFMHDCEFEGTDRAIRIKSRRDRGGVVEKIYARDIKVRDMKEEVVILNMDYTADKNAASGGRVPLFRDMCFERITAGGAPVAIRITGTPDSPIADIRFHDLELSTTRGVIAKNVSGLRFEDLRLETARPPVFDLENASDITLQNISASRGADPFLQLGGTASRGIRIGSSPAAKGRITQSKDVPAGAVTVN
ncbi:MAG: glycoside hydrolase family 28 protein [Verrucomicrobiota bacterium]